jgi:hypothetical protein
MPPNLPEAKWGHEMVTVKEKIRNRNALGLTQKQLHRLGEIV